MTDDVGVLQHATFDVPNRSCGYCTDDVGRALIVACDAAAQPGDRVAGRLVTTYLSYLHDAQLPDGWFHNFMGYDRGWQDAVGAPDAVGRAIWGLGYAEAYAPRVSWKTLAGQMRRRALDAIPRMEYVRSYAYASLGLAHALASRPDDELVVRALLDDALGKIAAAYDAVRTDGWAWCEPALTYDNARLPEALLRGGTLLGNPRYRDIGLAMLDFYCGAVIEDDTFVPVGSAGWYPRGGVKSRSGQQPLEAAAMVDASLVAFDLTGDERWQRIAEIAHAWYFGNNTHHATLVAHGGCCDGIDDGGVNPNMGAESTLCYLMSASALAKRTQPRTLRVAQ